MALRDQPYIPLYVQDVLTDEKLIECSASSHGVYLRLLCILHKQEEYGLICLKQKYKQTDSKITNFASMIDKQMPFSEEIIRVALEELSSEGVITIEDDRLFQKRMVKDGQLSLLRAVQGKKGGSTVTKQYGTQGFLYFMSDGYTKHKIGISKNPQNRLYRLRSDLGLPKHFDIIKTYSVSDMGKSEDIAQGYFDIERDGEWLVGSYKEMLEKFDLLEAIIEANGITSILTKTQANTAYANEDVIQDKKEIVKGKKRVSDSVDLFNQFWKLYPKKEAKIAAEKAFLKTNPLEFNQIIESLKKWTTSDKWTKQGGEFIPNAATWLNGERWNDELPGGNESGPKKLAGGGYE